MTPIAERQRIIDRFHKALIAEQEHRRSRNEFVPDPMERHEQPEWVLAERRAMLRLTNDERMARGLPVVAEADIYRREISASGHVDYTFKFALRCAFLAMGDENP